jgi:uncharacterized metal-binding protein
MPNYKTHDIIGITTSVISGITTITTGILSFGDSILLGAAIALGTYYLSPDLDIDSMIYNRWGIFKYYWYPYKQIIAHRSIWSHSGPLSASIRLLYMFCIPLLLLMIYLPRTTLSGGEVVYMIEPYLSSIVIIWAGVSIADTAHVVADRIV